MVEPRLNLSVKEQFRLVAFPLFVVLFTSCSSFGTQDWPASVPPRQFFLDAYSADENNKQLQSQAEYLRWINSYYQGNLTYQTGWLDIQSVLLSSPNVDQPGRLKSQLEFIGAQIGAEWAKHNAVRLIDTRLLALWGSALQLAVSADQQSESLELISADIDKLLSGQLLKEDIVESRYPVFLQGDGFGDF